MSLTDSLYVGLSGLDSNSTDLQVIGNNISNADTVGFKGSRADFEADLAQQLMGGNGQVGSGTSLESVQQMMQQGTLEQTGNATDLALQGSGMFMVNGSYNGQSGNFYTRDGQFTLNSSGSLVDQNGLSVQGYAADGSGNITGSLGSLNFGTATSPPNATTAVSIDGNLNSADVPPAVTPFSATNAAATSNFSTATTIYDTLGNAHQAQVYFTNTGTGAWTFNVVTDGGGLQGGTAGTQTVIGSGTLTFGANGQLTAETQSSNFNPLGATDPQALTFNFGDPTGAGGTGLKGITQFSSPDAVTYSSQDGYGSGNLASVAVAQTGQITGTFSNGQTRVLGEVAVANFQAPDQLSSAGGNLFNATPGSGTAAVGAAGTGGRGSVVSGFLEQSNVDLSTQLVNMITVQSDYEANSKTVSTADTLLQTLIQMKQ